MPEGDETLLLAAEWGARIPAIAQDMYGTLAAQIPVVQSDPELAALTLASCSSNVESILSMLLTQIPASAAEAPVTALEHARLMAKRGAEVNDTLRFYRLGHGWFLEHWSEELRGRISDAGRLLTAMQEATAFTVEYLDIVSARVSAEHLAERERRQRRAAVVRADVIQALLAGSHSDVPAAERALAHRLDRAQLAYICWSPSGGTNLESAATAIALGLGARRPLLWPQGPQAVVAWVIPSGPHDDPADAASGALADAGAEEISVAFGSVAVGLDGFRRSHDEARSARRVAELAGDLPARVVYEDVALVDLLCRDLSAAQRFVQLHLGDLATRDPAHDALRETARRVLTPRGGIAEAARQLDVHRNTILQRLRRVEALRGRPIDDRPEELLAALILAATLPPA